MRSRTDPLDNIARKRDSSRMTYPGGKNGAGVYQTLINLMPPHDVYVEPFLGAGAIMRMKRPAKLNIGIDLDSLVISAWAAAQAKVTVPAAIAGNGERRRQESPDPARTAASAENDFTRSPRAESDDTGSQIAETAERQRQYLDLASLSLPSGPGEFSFRHCDAMEFFRHGFAPTPATLVYCDPPYVRSTRTPRDVYQYEMTDAQHLELLSLIKELPCMVMISGYSSPMYAKALKGWNATSFQTGTRGGRPAAEWVWYNYDRPVELHDYRFLGQDFRERERIKRKMKRWTERLKRQPLLERQALLAAIAATAESIEAGQPRRK